MGDSFDYVCDIFLPNCCLGGSNEDFLYLNTSYLCKVKKEKVANVFHTNDAKSRGFNPTPQILSLTPPNIFIMQIMSRIKKEQNGLTKFLLVHSKFL